MCRLSGTDGIRSGIRCWHCSAGEQVMCLPVVPAHIARRLAAAGTLKGRQHTFPPKHIAAAVSPTRQGVLGMTLTILASAPAASSNRSMVMPAAMEMMTCLSSSTGFTSASTVATYCGLTEMKMTSAFFATCGLTQSMGC
jgi:hypothetical protein